MELTDMMNIGREMSRKLCAVGIDTPEELIRLGAKEAFFRLKLKYPNVCLVHLYTLEGAVSGQAYNALCEEKKRELKEFSYRLK